MTRVLPQRCHDRLGRAVHEVRPAAAMRMDVDEAGREITAAGIDKRRVERQRDVRAGVGDGDPVRLADDDAVVNDAVGQDERPVVEDDHSIDDPSYCPATCSSSSAVHGRARPVVALLMALTAPESMAGAV